MEKNCPICGALMPKVADIAGMEFFWCEYDYNLFEWDPTHQKWIAHWTPTYYNT